MRLRTFSIHVQGGDSGVTRQEGFQKMGLFFGRLEWWGSRSSDFVFLHLWKLQAEVRFEAQDVADMSMGLCSIAWNFRGWQSCGELIFCIGVWIVLNFWAHRQGGIKALKCRIWLAGSQGS